MDYPSKIDFDKFVQIIEKLSTRDDYRFYAEKYINHHLMNNDDPSIYQNPIVKDSLNGIIEYKYWNPEDEVFETFKVDLLNNLWRQTEFYKSRYFDEVKLWYFRNHQNDIKYAKELLKIVQHVKIKLESEKLKTIWVETFISISEILSTVINKLIRDCLKNNDPMKYKKRESRLTFIEEVLKLVDTGKTVKWNLQNISSNLSIPISNEINILFSDGKINRTAFSKLLAILFFKKFGEDIAPETFRDDLKSLI